VGSDGFPWLLVGIGGAAALAAVVWWIVGDEEHRRRIDRQNDAPAGRREPVTISTAVADRGAAESAGGRAPRGIDPLSVVDGGPSDDVRASAAESLERLLGSDRLWATVRDDGDAVVVQSAFCAEPGMAAHVDAAIVDLKAAGFRHLRCVEQHGSIAFERDF